VKITGDSDLIAQALGNLLENAMHHASPGSPIDVRLENDRDCARIIVEDRGQGISAGDRQRVLEPFVRLDGSRSTSGVGLGLSIVNAIAKLHFAMLTLEDAGPGLRAGLTFPKSL